MLREAAQAEFLRVRRFPVRRYLFSAAGLDGGAVTVGAGELRALQLGQAARAVPVADLGRRRYWWFRERFWWEDDGLAQTDVMALVLDRERRAQRRLDRAHALMAGEAAVGQRTAITADVKRAVWERCGGSCAECGAAALLEFDHVIPLAMGGSSSARNLQLLCADCNRVKGASL